MTTTPLSDWLMAAVRESGLSGYALARLARVPAPVITRWLSGDRGLTLTTADKLAAALGLSPPKKIPKKTSATS